MLAPSLWRLWSGEHALGFCVLEPQFVNPARHTDLVKMMDAINAEFLVGGRKWVWLVIDGSPFMYVHGMCGPKYPVRLRTEPLHEEMNGIRAFMELVFPIIGHGFAKTQSGYDSERQLK